MTTVDRWPLPDRIEEMLPPKTARIEAARRQVLDLFHRRGYEFVVTPYIEYPESLLTGAGQDLDLRTFKVTNPASGRLMGFRVDVTSQVVRMDAHSLRRKRPNCLCYASNVLYAQSCALSTSRSPIQLGVELYGNPSPASDIEVISLMLEVLEIAEMPDVHMNLGHVGIYRGLTHTARLSGEVEQQLLDALQRKAVDEVEVLTASLPVELRDMLRVLVELCGGRDALEQGRVRLAATLADTQVALNKLVEIADPLTGRLPGLSLYFDLDKLRGYHYHTGAVSAAFVPGVGQSIAQDGRYGDIGTDFGRARSATGLSADLRGPVALGQARLGQAVSGIWASAEKVGPWQAVQRLRRDGQRVVQALPGQGAASTREAGCDRQLMLHNGDWQVAPLAS